MSSVKTKWILEFGDGVSAGVQKVGAYTADAKANADAANGSFKKLKRTLGTLFSAYAVIKAVKGVFNLGVAAEQTDTKFKVLTGSAQNAHKMLKQINEFANVTPFDNNDLKKSAELLLNFGIAQQKILPTMKMLGDVSGGNREKLQSLSLAYAQIQSTGKLMGQDLLQMINAGFNPLTVIAKKTGKSMAQLKEEMSKGKISAKMVEDAFRTATGEGGRFYNMMDQVSQTAGGKFSTLVGVARSKIAMFSKNKLIPWLKKALDFGIRFVNGFGKVYDSLANLVKPIKPLIKTIFDIVKSTGDASKSMNILTGIMNGAAVVIEIVAGGLNSLLTLIKPIAPTIIKVVAAFWAYKKIQTLVTIAQWKLNAAFMANPIGVVVGAIVVLTGAMVYAYNHFEKFRGVVDGAWAAIKGFATLIKNYVIGRFKELLSGITGIGKALYYFFTGSWKKAWEAGKQGVTDLMGAGTKKQLLADAKNIGKAAGEAYDKGAASVKYKDFKPGKSLAGIMSYQVKPTAESGMQPANVPVYNTNTDMATTGNKPVATKGITGSSSGGGGGKVLNMTLNIKNIFQSIKGTASDIEDVADKVTARIVTKLRDADIALG